MAKILAECAQDWGAAWLAGIGGQVHALWQLAYCPPSDAAEADVRQDLQRLGSWLPQEVGKWREFENVKAGLGAELDNLRAPASADLELQLESETRELELYRQIAAAGHNATSCKRRILKAIAPAGRDFEPSRDYQAELAATEISAASKTRGQGGRKPDRRSKTGTGGPRPTGEAPAASRAADVGLAGTGGETARNGDGSDAAVFWDGTWEEWLERIGDPSDSGKIRPWNDGNVPPWPATSPFVDPDGFAEVLGSKFKGGLLARPEETLRVLVNFLHRDPQKSRREWKPIYRELLRLCLRDNSGSEDSQDFSFALLRWLLGMNPDRSEYAQLVDTARRLTSRAPDRPGVERALELSELFLVSRSADQDCLGAYLADIHEYVSGAGWHLAAKRQKMHRELEKFLARSRDGEAGDAIPAISAQKSRQLSSFLRGKRVVIYTLQLHPAYAVRDRLRDIEPSAKIELLDNEVWSDSLRDPIRNADLCVMVRSASKHAVTENIEKTRRLAGKALITPSSAGVESLLAALYSAAEADRVSAPHSGL